MVKRENTRYQPPEEVAVKQKNPLFPVFDSNKRDIALNCQFEVHSDVEDEMPTLIVNTVKNPTNLVPEPEEEDTLVFNAPALEYENTAVINPTEPAKESKASFSPKKSRKRLSKKSQLKK